MGFLVLERCFGQPMCLHKIPLDLQAAVLMSKTNYLNGVAFPPAVLTTFHCRSKTTPAAPGGTELWAGWFGSGTKVIIPTGFES